MMDESTESQSAPEEKVPDPILPRCFVCGVGAWHEYMHEMYGGAGERECPPPVCAACRTVKDGG